MIKNKNYNNIIGNFIFGIFVSCSKRRLSGQIEV